MKSKPRQSRPPDKHAQPSRVSERIAERPSRQPSRFTVHREPRIKKQVTAPKITQSHQKKAALSKPRQAAQKKQITPKRSQQSRQEKAKKASIFREALEEHEKRTANEPLPDELAKVGRQYKPCQCYKLTFLVEIGYCSSRIGRNAIHSRSSNAFQTNPVWGLR